MLRQSGRPGTPVACHERALSVAAAPGGWAQQELSLSPAAAGPHRPQLSAIGPTDSRVTSTEMSAASDTGGLRQPVMERYRGTGSNTARKRVSQDSKPRPVWLADPFSPLG